jgi:MscS family membrane protein
MFRLPPAARGRALLVLIGIALLPGSIASAQLGLTPPAAPAKTEASRDPLGRETPRGTVLGFMRASRDGEDQVALGYLNTTLEGQDAIDLARKLHVVLDSRLPARLNELSDRPEGALDNPLRPDQDIVGTISTPRGPLELYVERVSRQGSAPVWLFSRTTLQAVPEVYDSIDVVSVDQYLPEFLTKPRVFGIRLATWLVFLVFVPLFYHLLGVLSAWGVAAWRRRGAGELVHDRLPGAVRVLILAIAIRALTASIDLPLFERQFWAVATAVFMIVGVVWLVLVLEDYAERYMVGRIQASGLGEKVALLRLGRRAVDVLVIATGGLVALGYFGIDPTAALAGLGIGGIAVALAAQKTLENVIGGLSLVFDEAVRVGDVLKMGETVGTVDQIGLRSTRIRTVDRTVVTVPNGQIATASIETLSLRDKFLFRHVVGLQYETTAAQLRAVVEGVRELMVGQRGIDVESVRVRFFRLGASSLDVELFAYVFATDWGHFLEIQEQLLLRVMEIVDEAGTGVAFPSQTVYFKEQSASQEAGQPGASPVRRLAAGGVERS